MDTERLQHTINRAFDVLKRLKKTVPREYQEALDHVDGVPRETRKFNEALRDDEDFNPQPDCDRCDGKGYYLVANGPDDCDKEICDCVTNQEEE